MRIVLAGIAVAVLSITVAGQPAWADMGGPPAPGYVIVQQALSYLVTDPSPSATANALMKVDDALAAHDETGVDIAEVTQARSALRAGDTETGRALLQGSITSAVSQLKPAVGEETGTTIVLAPYVPRQGLSTESWIFLALSLLVALGGAALASRLRPREGLRDLSRDIHGVDGYRHHAPATPSIGADTDAR